MGGIPGMWRKREIGKNEQMESRQREKGRETEREREEGQQQLVFGPLAIFLALSPLPPFVVNSTSTDQRIGEDK